MSCVNLISTFLGGFALLFSAAAVCMPAWSTTDVLSSNTTTASFSAGVWGYCTRPPFASNALEFDNCISYFSWVQTKGHHLLPATTVAPLRDEGKTTNSSLPPSRPLGSSSTASCSLRALLASIAATSPTSMADWSPFVDRVCGAYGQTSLGLTLVSLAFGLQALVLATSFMAFCVHRPWLSVASKASTVLAWLTCACSALLWFIAAYNVRGISLGASFMLQAWATALYLASFLAVHFLMPPRRLHKTMENPAGVP
ncbi:Aste57867_13275 [Aphanomyces stellatus]|uniref:Aste57867_13275 protein n=1 Tax=Aphanomyces stellatus TaxID=120398 RepID=A0A485KYK2_9STRA|nr:hypothetical protein As57867_013226 [Aphanomyces stellatus]VFT90114.1 Aste57867_13275 [Aphanomyces stellatus]